ncbi:MAG: DUF1330 domain-containing protein [Actinobacteria bacterium]|nr:DUF1330 domain-containing protein [Actinomycetota bacterium]
MSISPNAEQFREFAAAPDEGPVVMLNLLKFKPAATGDSEKSGEQEYRAYGDVAVAMIEERGGSVIWAGRVDQILIGDAAQHWDQVLLVQYPSRDAFLDMVSQPSYQEAHQHRESGLERTVVVACTPRLDRIAELGRS